MFYSQKVAQRATSTHICTLCGKIAFNTYHEYETHRRIMHMMKTDIKPENTTGRSAAYIVRDAEATWLKPYLIGGPLTITATNEKEHLPACRCMPLCFNRALDALIASQEAALSLNQGGDNA